ncbi:hypothetical protein BDN72DRAFT_882450 [Pluteus cervinus]|uniref:Uncharacterized protein n=1 Tax=Pluteus cervinus TaxID=181527 RepID=A0ACD3AAZ8_9AGAR|nr:hypothetical protein BDN72DRAFT_882450 [Pluteus cervinus]
MTLCNEVWTIFSSILPTHPALSSSLGTMSRDYPSDILLQIFSHLDSQSKQRLCLVSRYFHSIFAPLVLRHIRFLFCQERASTESIDARLKTCSSSLSNLYQHARTLRVKTNSFYLSRHVTTSLLPALWRTMASLASLKSLELEWERHGEENLEMMERYQSHVIESVLHATKDRLDRLVLIPDAASQSLPVGLEWIRGLKSLRIVHDQLGWGCSGFFWYDSEDDRACQCHRQWMKNALKPLISANPELETLEIVQGCRNGGPEPNDVLPASLKGLRNLTISGLELPSNQKRRASLVELSPLRNLRHLTVRAPYKWLKIDAFWGALKAAQPPLETLASFQVCLSMVNYLNSFSGLRSLEIQRIDAVDECHSPEILSLFLDHALPSHAYSLERLEIHYQSDVSTLSGWDFDPNTWAPALAQLSKLKHLAIYPPPHSAHHEPITTSQLFRSYQALLDNVGDMSSLITLKINHPQPTFECGTGHMHWSSGVQRALNNVVPKLRVKNASPRELVLYTGVQHCVPLGSEGWGYNPVRVCVPEVDSSDEDDDIYRA